MIVLLPTLICLPHEKENISRGTNAKDLSTQKRGRRLSLGSPRYEDYIKASSRGLKPIRERRLTSFTSGGGKISGLQTAIMQHPREGG